MRGFERALLVAAGIAVVGAIVAFVLVRPHEEAAGRAPAEQRRTAEPVRAEGGLLARRPGAIQGGGGPGGNSFPPENAPGCGSGGVSRSRRPLPGVASR